MDAELIRHALKVARQHGFAEVEIERGDDRFAASLERKRTSLSAATAIHEEPSSNGYLEIKSPLVGYFRPAETTLELGKSVKQGDVVAVIAALGLANDVESPHSGEVAEVLVSDGDPVEYGQTIARLKVSV